MVGARVGLYEGATDGRFVDGICEGPVGDTEGTKGCLEVVGKTVGPEEGTAVGRHLLKV